MNPAPTSDFFTLDRTYIPPVRLTPDRTGLVVVDMQYNDASVDQGFGLALSRIEPGSMDYFNSRNESVVVPSIASLVAECRKREISIIYVCVGSDYRDLRDMPARHRTWIRTIEERSGVPDILWSENPAYAVRREFAPQPGDTIVKKTAFGAFTSSMLDETLRSMQIETLVVAGIATNCCVSTTIRDASDLGYGVVVVEECTGDYDAATHDMAIRGLFFNFARVCPNVTQLLAALDDEEAI